MHQISLGGLLALQLAAGSVAFAVSAPAETVNSSVQLVPIEETREFPEAVERDALRRACAPTQPVLAAFFAERGLPFQPPLVKKTGNSGLCHVYYEPSLPGFRALPDDRAITGLFAAIDPLSFVVNRKPIGDSLDILKATLPRLPRPIDVNISVGPDFDLAYWPDALKRHFPDTIHRITLRAARAGVTHPWMQDHVKAGEVNGEVRILRPRRLFEGRSGDGELFLPLLESLEDDRFVRSKISWEGGDLQFFPDPRDPNKRILMLGGSAKDYWGKALTPEEYAYVLRLEFGADASVDFSRVGPHTDYLVSYLPADGIVLVGEPVRQNYDLAQAAAETLLKQWGNRAPPELRALPMRVRLLSEGATDSNTVRLLTSYLRSRLQQVESSGTPELAPVFQTHIDQYCPDNPQNCFRDAGKQVMLRVNPQLLKTSADLAADYDFDLNLSPKLLGIIESQLADAPFWRADALTEKANELRRLGYKIVRAPMVVAPEMVAEWPGVSPMNQLVVERKIFVPTIGLGKAENRLLETIGKRLNNLYEIVPVDARFAVITNGGIHCVYGIVRDPATPVKRITD